MSNMSYPETNQTTAADVRKSASVDYVNTFTKGVQSLVEALGLFEAVPVPNGGSITTYKYTDDVKDGAVSEGELIPLSKTTRTVDQTINLTLKKWRKSTTAEAIQAAGTAAAVDATDARLVAGIQGVLKDSLFKSITGTEKTSDKGKTLQEALANMWGKLSGLFEDYDGATDPAGDGADAFVYFVNPLDVAVALGSASINSTGVFGFRVIKDFLGMGTAIVSSKVTKGWVFGTAAKNLKLAYVPANGGDLASAFGLTSDATGLIGITHANDTTNASIDTLAMGAWAFFAETKDGVLKGQIDPGAAAASVPSH